MIPKRIFYLWCGSPKPVDVKMCLLGWQRHLPDYEICEINEKENPYFNFSKQRRNNTFFDFVCRNKMWAYVADYVRFCVLEKFGGIWLDTDIQVLNSFSGFLNNDVFFGCENISSGHIETAVIGASAHHQLLRDIVHFYQEKIWTGNLYTSPKIVSFCLQKYGYHHENAVGNICRLKNNITIYPPEYFYPLPFDKDFSPKMLTAKSVTVHWWKNSWSRPEVINWLKNIRPLGADKAVKTDLKPYVRLYLFGFLHIGKYCKNSETVFFFGFPFLKIRQFSRKTVVYLLCILPLLKWK